MARVKAFQTFFTTRQSDTYRLLILDEGADVVGGVNASLYGYPASTTTTPRHIDIAHDSVMVTWDAPTDSVHSAIIGSRLEVTYVIDPDNYYFTDIIKARQEGEICCVLQRHKGINSSFEFNTYPIASYETVFIGCLSPESVEFDFSNPPFELKLIFTDGISLLRDIAYEKENGDPWTDDATFETFRTQIGNCLSRLPHLSVFDDGVNERFFTEQLDIFHYNHGDTDGDLADTGEPASILDKSGCNQNIWYETRLHDNPFNRKHRVVTGGSTCYEVIEDIMTSLGATFMAHRGSFWAVSPFLQDNNGVSNEERAFKADLRTMTDSSFQDSAYTTGTSDFVADNLENRYDFTSADILLGSTRSYLNPAKAVMYTHSKGGAPYIFKYTLPITAHGDTFAQNTFVPAPIGVDPTTPSYDSGFGGYGSIISQEGARFPINNPDYKFIGGQELLVRGRVVIDSVLTATDDAFVGAQPVIKMKIKVGDKYLKQTTNIVPDSELTQMTNFGRIHIAIANPMNPSGGDFTGWQPIEITSDPEWTDVVGDRFEFPFMIEGQMEPPIDTVEYTDGENVIAYPVGMNTRRHESKAERMRFRWEDRKKQHDLKLDFVLPALPGTSSDTYEGIEIDVDVIVWRNTDGEGTMQSTPFTTSFVPYEACRFHNFRVLAGQDIEDEDILYVASADNPEGLETIDGGSSLLASRLDTFFGDIGMLKSNQPAHREDGTDVDGFGQYWFSESESGRTPSASSGLPSMRVVANSHLAIRQELREIYNISFLTQDHHDFLLWPLRRIIIETGTPDAVVQIMSCTHHVMASQYDIYGFEIAQKYAGITGTTSVDANAIFRRGPAPLPGPRPIAKIAATSGLPTADISKLGFITVNNSGIDGINFGGNNIIAAEVIEEDQERQFVDLTEKSQILDSAEAVSRISRDAGTGNITGFTVQSGSKPLTADQINDTSTTNKFTTQAGKDKLTNISVSQPVDLDTMESELASLSDDVAVLQTLADPDNNEGVARGGQTGDEVATFTSNGVLSSVADGSNGQFLQTNGSGVLSWATASGGGGGWHGSTSLIKVLPTEFMGDDVGRAIVLTRIEDDTLGTLGVQINQTTGKIFAFNEIPTGYKATHVHVYTSSAVTNGVKVFHYNTTSGATSNSTTGNTNVNIDITDLTSSTTNALVIQVAPGATNVYTYSAHITITSV